MATEYYNPAMARSHFAQIRNLSQMNESIVNIENSTLVHFLLTLFRKSNQHV